MENGRVAVTGSSGLIGTALSTSLASEGHAVVRVVRREPRPGASEVRWNPAAGTVDAAGLEGVDAVIHLAGESIAGGRWTESRKRAILESRRDGTRLVAETIARLERRPRVLVCASAVGYYGNRGDEIVTEETAPGSDFLAEVCKVWEAAADPARAAGIRLVHLRQGVVLRALLSRMTTPFKLGVGGVVGSGRQWWSWIALDDVVRAYHRAIADKGIAGPVNVTSPSPVRNADFTKALGRVLHRPTVLPLPATIARLVFGELADALLLGGQRVKPAKLEAAGFDFRHRELEDALRHELAP